MFFSYVGRFSGQNWVFMSSKTFNNRKWNKCNLIKSFSKNSKFSNKLFQVSKTKFCHPMTIWRMFHCHRLWVQLELISLQIEKKANLGHGSQIIAMIRNFNKTLDFPRRPSANFWVINAIRHFFNVVGESTVGELTEKFVARVSFTMLKGLKLVITILMSKDVDLSNAVKKLFNFLLKVARKFFFK